MSWHARPCPGSPVCRGRGISGGGAGHPAEAGLSPGAGDGRPYPPGSGARARRGRKAAIALKPDACPRSGAPDLKIAGSCAGIGERLSVLTALNSPEFLRRLQVSSSAAVRTRWTTASRSSQACASGCRISRCNRTRPCSVIRATASRLRSPVKCLCPSSPPCLKIGEEGIHETWGYSLTTRVFLSGGHGCRGRRTIGRRLCCGAHARFSRRTLRVRAGQFGRHRG